MVSFLAEVKIFRFWSKTMDYHKSITHGLIFANPKKFGEKYTTLKLLKIEI